MLSIPAIGGVAGLAPSCFHLRSCFTGRLPRCPPEPVAYFASWETTRDRGGARLTYCWSDDLAAAAGARMSTGAVFQVQEAQLLQALGALRARPYVVVPDLEYPGH